MVEFGIFRGWSRAKSRTYNLAIRRVNFSLYRALLGRITWIAALERQGVCESWVDVQG